MLTGNPLYHDSEHVLVNSVPSEHILKSENSQICQSLKSNNLIEVQSNAHASNNSGFRQLLNVACTAYCHQASSFTTCIQLS